MNGTDNDLPPDVRFHLIRRMERQKVLALAGPALLAHERKYLEFHAAAGVVLFERNVQSVSQVGELVGAVTDALGSDGLPPLILVDHEGDFIAELRGLVGVPPAPLAIAATEDLELAREVARETGRAMRKLGVNGVLGPVADCYLNAESPITGLRTFGADPERVGEFVAATVAGFHEAGVLTCAKHFPGHGSTPDDSHETLPEVRKTRDELDRVDLVPFRRAVEAGTDMMMTAHVAYPMGGDSLVPATFDRSVVEGLLRETLGFDGVVISDAVEMAGARSYARGRYGGFAAGLEHAFLVGIDLLLHTRPVPEQVQLAGERDPVMSINVMETIIKTLEQVVDRSRIDEKLAQAAEENEALRHVLDILDAAHARVTRLRERLDSETPAHARPARGRSADGKVIALDAYPAVPRVYRDVAERSVCRLRDWDAFESMEPGERFLVVPVEWRGGESLHAQEVDGFLDTVCKQFPRARRTGVVVGFGNDEDGTAHPLVRAGAATVIDAARWGGGPAASFDVGPGERLVVVVSARGTPPEEFLAGLGEFSENASPAAVVLTGWPVTDWIPDGTPVLWSLGASTQAASAVAGVLAGRVEPREVPDGLLP